VTPVTQVRVLLARSLVACSPLIAERAARLLQTATCLSLLTRPCGEPRSAFVNYRLPILPANGWEYCSRVHSQRSRVELPATLDTKDGIIRVLYHA
jgi:hypothetical protein